MRGGKGKHSSFIVTNSFHFPHLLCAPPPPALCPSPLSVHMKVSEKLSAVAGRDGGLDSFEVLGMFHCPLQ